jgi:hypothetical protein
MIKGRHLALYQIFKTTVFTTKYMINIHIISEKIIVWGFCVFETIFYVNFVSFQDIPTCCCIRLL